MVLSRISTRLHTFWRYWDFRRRRIRVAKGTKMARGVMIGSYTRINAASHLGPCTIGKFCAIGGRLIVRSTNHSTAYLNMQSWAQRNVIGSSVRVDGLSQGTVKIGNAVWIGDSVIILPDVTIGDGAVIGAGSVVTKSIPPYAVAAGVPAKVLRFRFDEKVISILRRIEWWNWPIEKIRAERWLFEIDLQQASAEELLSRIAENELLPDALGDIRT